MKIVVAMDSFKGSLTASEACSACARGIVNVYKDANIFQVPMADGGEGTVQALVDATGGRIVHERVTGPLGNRVEAFFGILGDGTTAVVEMAAASGLPLINKEQRNPLITTTFGTGELIKKALDSGCNKLYIGIGGSATNDGGAGMAQALGARLLDVNGDQIHYGGGNLIDLHSIDVSLMDARLKETEITVLSDVDNPLCGEQGAAYVYGPQKGATSTMADQLDRGLDHYARIIKKELQLDILDMKGAGAAGGLGGGLVAFLGAKLQPGIETVIEITGLVKKVSDADLVITGEGKIDQQTIHGKTPIGVAKAAKRFGKPVVGVTGCRGQDMEAVHEHGIDAVFSIMSCPISLEEAMETDKAAKLMEMSVEQIFRMIQAVKFS